MPRLQKYSAGVSSRRQLLRHPQVPARSPEVVSLFFSFVKILAAPAPTAAFPGFKPSGNECDTPGSPPGLNRWMVNRLIWVGHVRWPQRCRQYQCLFVSLCNCVCILLYKYDVLHFLSPSFNKAKLCYVIWSSKNVKNYLLLSWLQIDSQISGTQREKNIQYICQICNDLRGGFGFYLIFICIICPAPRHWHPQLLTILIKSSLEENSATKLKLYLNDTFLFVLMCDMCKNSDMFVVALRHNRA